MDVIQAMGAYATITVQEVGSYAGFAAVLGLAVLSALYFSQARDVKRLREWAGRAPERDAEARLRVAAATAAGQQRQTPAAQPATPATAQPATPATAQPATPAAAQPAAATAGNSGNSDAATKAPAVAAAAAPAGVAASSAAGASTASPSPTATASKAPAVAAGTVAANSRPLARPSATTSILGAQEPARDPWYRRIPARYIALIVAGVLVVGGGIAVGAVQLLSNDDSGGGDAQQSSSASSPEAPSTGVLKPGDVSVAVLNATPVQGLANQFGDKAQAEGFKKDNVGNAPGGQQRAETVVLYAPGKEREAKLVRRSFKVSNIEPIDPESQALAPQADVILVIGADNTQ